MTLVTNALDANDWFANNRGYKSRDTSWNDFGAHWVDRSSATILSSSRPTKDCDCANGNGAD